MESHESPSPQPLEMKHQIGIEKSFFSRLKGEVCQEELRTKVPDNYFQSSSEVLLNSVS